MNFNNLPQLVDMRGKLKSNDTFDCRGLKKPFSKLRGAFLNYLLIL